MHFHWGKNNTEGSEHTFNGISYPLELHLVYYSCDYYSLSEAIDDYANGNILEIYDDHHVLAVIGILFEIGDENSALQQILNNIIINGVKKYHSTNINNNVLNLYYTNEFDINELLPVNKEFIGYSGSLTTPPCYQTVRWHVMKNTMTVSITQLKKFRSILGSTNPNNTIAPNYRDIQSLNGRTLYDCVDN